MTAGIYLITFEPSGLRYVGKSKDLSARWNQHIESLAKGKHAKKLQDVYSSSTNMKFTVVLECHEDHIDLMEAHFINRLEPELNSQIPESKYEWGGVSPEFLKLSTMEHYNKIQWSATRIEELRDKNLKLSAEVRNYKYDGQQGQDILDLENEVAELNSALAMWANAPWWKRIFM